MKTFYEWVRFVETQQIPDPEDDEHVDKYFQRSGIHPGSHPDEIAPFWDKWKNKNITPTSVDPEEREKYAKTKFFSKPDIMLHHSSPGFRDMINRTGLDPKYSSSPDSLGIKSIYIYKMGHIPTEDALENHLKNKNWNEIPDLMVSPEKELIPKKSGYDTRDIWALYIKGLDIEVSSDDDGVPDNEEDEKNYWAWVSHYPIPRNRIKLVYKAEDEPQDHPLSYKNIIGTWGSS